MNMKKNFPLILGISIPILMILFVAGSIYLPGLFIKPQYNFLYVSNDDSYYAQPQYSVQNGILIKNEVKRPQNQYNYSSSSETKLYIHDVIKNESREVTFEKAQNLKLNPNTKSPDEFEVVYGNRGNGFFPFFFWSESDYNVRYLKGHNISKKLNLQLNGRSYYNNFRFLGWIEQK